MNEKANTYKKYSKGLYNKYNDFEQWIRISEGCPNKCIYCRESFENGTEPIYYSIPEIIRNKVKILDMNLLYKPRAKEIIKELGNKKVNNKIIYYELTCGIDYRYLTAELAELLYKNHFINIRFAWDCGFVKQREIKKCSQLLIKVGYKPKDIMIFILCNHKISYSENLLKLDLIKIWGHQVHDAYFDNQLPPNIKPFYWNIENIKDFRRKCRKHNQMVNYLIDPEFKAMEYINPDNQTRL